MAAKSIISLVTGANSGIGFETAKALAAASEGFHVILAGRDMTKVGAAISQIKDAGHKTDNLSGLQLDVTDQSSIAKAAATVREKFGRLDILINNAGIAPTGPDTLTMFQDTFSVNVFGPALVSEAFWPLLLKSTSPWLVYVSSETGSMTKITDPNDAMHVVGAGSIAYRSSKSALNMIAMHHQLEAKGTNLKVRVLCPGFVVSNLRGPSEEARTAGGHAGDPGVSARTILSILRGERDANASKLIYVDGAHGW